MDSSTLFEHRYEGQKYNMICFDRHVMGGGCREEVEKCRMYLNLGAQGTRKLPILTQHTQTFGFFTICLCSQCSVFLGISQM